MLEEMDEEEEKQTGEENLDRVDSWLASYDRKERLIRYSRARI